MSHPKDQAWSGVPAARRRLMSAIRGRDTKPELMVRRLLHKLGYRFRVNKRQFSARPDVLFISRKKAVFVHGCFWHAHEVCRSGRTPSTRSEYWKGKLSANKARDARVIQELESHGWEALVLWECQLKNEEWVAETVVSFLGGPKHSPEGKARAEASGAGAR
jgi:DNA mismatch endonuclease Vsr